MMTVPTPSIDPAWRARIESAFRGILSFSTSRRGYRRTFKAHSPDGRTLLELVELQGVLRRGSLLLALPSTEDLEMLKLGCWTLLYLKSLFPDWTDLESWVKEAAEWSTETEEPIEYLVQDYRILCRHDRVANVLEFQVIRARPD